MRWWPFVLIGLSVVALADGIPPDIQKIMDKMKSGQPPSPDEMTRLREWQTGMVNRANAPTPGQGDGIPCRIRVTQSYTVKGNGSTEAIDITGWTEATMFPSIDGSDDYFKTIVGGGHPSSFRFMPILGKGGGSAHYSMQGPTVIDRRGELSNARFGVMLVTTGKGDALFPAGTGFDAAVDGHYSGDHGMGSGDFHDRDLRGFIGATTAPFPDEQRHTPQGNQPTPTPKLQLSYKAMADAVKSGKPTVVTGSETFDWTDNGDHVFGKSTIEIQLRPPNVEIIVQPKSEDDYEKWLPMPDAADGGDKLLFHDPKPFPVRVVLHDTSKGGPATGKAVVPANSTLACDLEVKLTDVSHHDGVAMNYPAGKGDGKPDLFFPKDHQPAGAVIAGDGQKMLVEHAKELTVLVAARDTGAFGSVIATCKDFGTSRNPRTGEPNLAMPMDDNKNQVADEWERSYGIYERNYPPTWDSEDTPKGMKANGDGLSLFEEYRGVIDEVNGAEQFDRLDPRHMKLFLFIDATDRDATLWRSGARIYAAATKIEVRFLHSGTRMEQINGVLHWLNFHKTDFTNGKQAALVLVDKGDVRSAPGYTKSIDGHNDLLPFTPMTTAYINISRPSTEFLVKNWATTWVSDAQQKGTPSTFVAGIQAAGLDLAKLKPLDAPAIAALANRVIAWETMHEIGHATGGLHHGLGDSDKQMKKILDKYGDDEKKWPAGVKQTYVDDEDARLGGPDNACPMRYWNDGPVKKDLARFLFSGWNLEHPADGGEWKFGPEDWPHMRIKPE